MSRPDFVTTDRGGRPDFLALEHAVTVAQQRLADARAAISAKPSAEDIEMAECLHDLKCRLSHEDMCGWYWDKSSGRIDWTKHPRQTYLVMARKVREAGVTMEQIDKFKETGLL